MAIFRLETWNQSICAVERFFNYAAKQAPYSLIIVDNEDRMKNLNYILAISFIVAWAVGFFTKMGEHSIHLLLVGALVLILRNVINDASNISSEKRHRNNSERSINNLLQVLATVLIVCWAIGFFVYNAGSLIHILLAIALAAIILWRINNTEAM